MMIPLAFNLGPWEIGVIAFLALLLFGGKRLPSLAKDLGNGIKEFKKSLTGDEEEKSTPIVQSQIPPVEKEPEVTKPTKSKTKS